MKNIKNWLIFCLISPLIILVVLASFMSFIMNSNNQEESLADSNPEEL